MTEERARELVGKEVVFPRLRWIVVLRSLFTDEFGRVCAMCYTQKNGEDWAGLSCGVEALEEV